MAPDHTRPAHNGTPLERADRDFVELPQEPRVPRTGVRILFAFPLTLAFTPRFEDIDSVQRATYVTTPLPAVPAAALFTAPAAPNRSLFQQNAKPTIVRVSSRPAAGLIVLMPALAGSVLLVVDVALGRAAGIAAGVGSLVGCLGLWDLLPKWVTRSGANGEPGSSEGEASAEAEAEAPVRASAEPPP